MVAADTLCPHTVVEDSAGAARLPMAVEAEVTHHHTEEVEVTHHRTAVLAVVDVLPAAEEAAMPRLRVAVAATAMVEAEARTVAVITATKT